VTRAERLRLWLKETLGYEPCDLSLFDMALTHRSAGGANNERLEFLGDAVLNLISAQYLIERFPEADEGELTRRHVSLVRRETLTEVATSLGLGAHLNAAGDDSMRSNPGVLADLCEAVIAATRANRSAERPFPRCPSPHSVSKATH